MKNNTQCQHYGKGQCCQVCPNKQSTNPCCSKKVCTEINVGLMSICQEIRENKINKQVG